MSVDSCNQFSTLCNHAGRLRRDTDERNASRVLLRSCSCRIRWLCSSVVTSGTFSWKYASAGPSCRLASSEQRVVHCEENEQRRAKGRMALVMARGNKIDMSCQPSAENKCCYVSVLFSSLHGLLGHLSLKVNPPTILDWIASMQSKSSSQ